MGFGNLPDGASLVFREARPEYPQGRKMPDLAVFGVFSAHFSAFQTFFSVFRRVFGGFLALHFLNKFD
jgi:hypothetical protein